MVFIANCLFLCVWERETETDRQKKLEYYCNEMELFLF